MNANPALLSSPHSDVLSPAALSSSSSSPEEATRRLLDEIKRRAKACVMTKDWYWADKLYARGIELLEGLDDDDGGGSGDDSNKKEELAILHSNRSLTLFHLTQLSQSQIEAQTAIDLNPDYVKAYWRLGQCSAALGDWDGALGAYEKAVEIDSRDDGEGGGKMVKALQKEVEKCKVKVEQERLLIMEGKFDDEAAAIGSASDGAGGGTNNRKKSVSTTTAAVAPAAATTKPTATSKPSVATGTTENATIVKGGGDDDEFTQSDHVRGYKIVNGKKTSFFHHEMTEEEKKLIGDIAPKKLNPNDSSGAAGTATGTGDATAAGAAAPAPTEGASAWNKAGTWEERDITAWASDTLTSTLLGCSYSVPDSDVTIKVVKANKMSELHDGGHASVAAVRGKKRYIYEFGYSLEWEMTGGNDEDDEDINGTLVLPDIDGTVASGEWHDVSDFTVVGGIKNSKRTFLMKYVRDGGLRQVIEDRIDDWVALLKATY